MFKKIIKVIYRDIQGQALVMVALAMTALIGFTAITVDYGNLAWQKRQLQNAADAAALAGAQMLTDIGKAKDEAREFASKNGFSITNGDIEAPYNGDSSKIKVTITKTFPNTFARVLNINESTLSASAVAQKKSIWNGEALPFINLTYDYSDTDPIAWTHVGNGIKGTITDFYTRNKGSSNLYFEVDYMDGITVTPGYSNGTKGLDDSKLKDGLEVIINPEDKDIKKFYLFSLNSKVIQQGWFTVNNGNKVELNKLNQLKNKDVIDPHQLVLIEVLFNDAKWANRHDLELTFLGNVFDLGNDDPDNPLPDFPTENLSSSGSSILIE